MVSTCPVWKACDLQRCLGGRGGGPGDEVTTTGELCAQQPAGERDVAATVARPRRALLALDAGHGSSLGKELTAGRRGRCGAGEGGRRTLKSPGAPCTQHSRHCEADTGVTVLFDNGGTVVRSKATRLRPCVW